jgi:hypothetical protein
MTSKMLPGCKPIFFALSALTLYLAPLSDSLAQPPQNPANVPPSNSHSARIPFLCADDPSIYPSIATELEPFQGVSAQEFLKRSVILGRPTDSSIGVSILTTENLTDVSFNYRAESEAEFNHSNDVDSIAKCVPHEYDLQNLNPDTRYIYQISYMDSEGRAQISEEASFHTARSTGATFSFAVQADPHLGSLFRFDETHPDHENQNEGANEDMYAVTMANTAASGADFLIDLGDTFMSEKNLARGLYASQVALYEELKDEDPSTSPMVLRNLPVTQEEVRGDYVYLRSLFASAANTMPLFFAVGNHEIEVRKFISPNGNGPDYSPALWGNNARHDLFPAPNSCETQDNSFYSASLELDSGLGVCHESYYSFVWGDAMFIVLDPMWEEVPAGRDAPRQWNKSLGLTQYNWLHDTLEENAEVPFKFVFMHNLVGGYLNSKGSERGGALVANYYEWGGCTEQLPNIVDASVARNLQEDIIHPQDFDIRASVNGEDGSNCTYEFDKYRPDFVHGPIQNMLIEAGVQVVFHGHDHLYVSEPHPNGIVYQEVPKPSDSGDGFQNAISRASEYNYDTTNAVPAIDTKVDANSGFVLVTVNAGVEDGEQTAKVEYRKSVQDTSCLDGSSACYTVDGEVETTYSVRAR